MKILLVCNFRGAVGGISGQVLLLQKHLRAEGHQADIFNTKRPLLQRLFLPITLFCKAVHYQVLHVHCSSNWGFMPAVLGVRVGCLLKRRTVVTYHGGGAAPFFDKHSRLVQRTLCHADANIVLAQFLEQVFANHHIPCTVIPNIIDGGESHHRPRRQLQPHIVCTRAHEALYDLPTLLRAFAAVQHSVHDATLTLVGTGTQHAALRQLAQQLDLHNVTFAGKVSNDEIYTYLDKADIFVSPATVDNMPVSLLEALEAGLLVVATRVGGVPDMIEHEHNGLLFDPGDADQLAALLLEAIRTQPLHILQKGHGSVARYRWENVRQPLLTLYQAATH